MRGWACLDDVSLVLTSALAVVIVALVRHPSLVFDD